MALSDFAIRAAKPRDKSYKLADSQGLFLLVTPSGGKLWRLKFRIAGAEKKLALGAYPDVTLAEARTARDLARKQLAEGTDPAAEKQRDKVRAQISASNTFGEIALELIEKRRIEGMAQATIDKATYFLSYLAPQIGKMAVSDIQPIDVLRVVKLLEATGKRETARRTLQFASRVFCFAVATARLKSDPTRDLKGALTLPVATHYGAITERREFGKLLRVIDGYDGNLITQIALKFAANVFVRPGELRHARWNEFNLDAAVWTIPAEKMKMRKAHRVPLSRQSLELINAIGEITGSENGYVFPSIRAMSRPMSENTINAALRRLGYAKEDMTGHGFRSTASTLLNESGKWHPDAIERALAHGDTDAVRSAYHRGAYWDERVRMAQWWSDYLDELRNDDKVASTKFNVERNVHEGEQAGHKFA